MSGTKPGETGRIAPNKQAVLHKATAAKSGAYSGIKNAAKNHFLAKRRDKNGAETERDARQQTFRVAQDFHLLLFVRMKRQLVE